MSEQVLDQQIAHGEARCPDEPTTQDIIASDKVGAPDWVRSESYEYLGSEDISTERYYDPEYAKKEYDTLWKRTWQFACREEHIPEPGDYYVYDLGRYSFIITRVSENDIRAYYNACLHRGTKLRASGTEGCTQEFKCSFHGWSWNLDGSLKQSTCEWDFPHVQADKFSLPQTRVETLAGFVFINMDQNAPSLEDYLGPEFMAHINSWGLENRYIQCHVSKLIPANWKLTMEAFMEAYHVIDTHPQVAVSNGDANSQYDVYGDHVNRFISPLGVLSPHLKGQYSEQDILDQFTVGDASVLGDIDRTLAEGESARQRMADTMRAMFEQATNTDLSRVSDSELLDCFSYTLFPNTFVFPGISLPMVYRFRPDPKDHRMTIYEVFFLRPVPKDGERPDPAEPVYLDEVQSFTEAEGMDPGFGAILDQDTENLILQQQGIEASAKPGLTLGNYQEIRVRHFEMTVDKYVSGQSVSGQ
ncbi:aromatic ring-hydroxylating dioxygenase subunit alpha [Aestuariicella hydrocarbonica]|uniref:Aromatic ring-hydroxylating dioxygenase subunit alpha n=1 Tax=Pseudomaricurvus hydrocarbonicus TaxID=1470433 RepID=A0A9E5MHA0_9GAMM|nr:aromatic ring-hydroxylating dioxygenase subunit alpha [Aestuariicella hydrocarbonica]NHO65691.1 aromatic ring-hydroxylating dioxygenase subunit alpha [Aestuariicella hydrocarbonica]